MNKILILLLLLCVPALSVAKGAQTTDATLAPIHTKMSLGLFGLLGSSMDYTLNGKALDSYDDFKNAIYPLHDPEASQMIHEAEEAHFGAMLLYGTGALTAIDVALVFPPTVVVHVDWIDRVLTGIFVGQFFVGAGALFDLNAEGRKFNAVQRYNHVVRQEKTVFLGFTPQVSWNGSGMNLGLSHTF